MGMTAEFQDVMGPRFKQVIHEELHRDVVAFMSAAHHDPDYNVELFILAPRDGEEPEDPLGNL